jgi:hypothetical protein
VAAHAVGVRHVQGRAEVAVECLDLGKGKRIVEWREARLRETLGDERQHRRALGQDAPVGHQCRHSTFGIDSQVLGSSLLIRGEVDANRGILSTRLFQRDVEASEQV